MKYIRTKNRIFENKPLEKHLGKRRGKGFEIVFKEQDILKQADTIEELCDEFVCDHNNGIRVIQSREHKPQFPFCKDIIDYLKRNNQTYYGAIWTNKGLIYVAKMNKKGELELL